MSTIHIIALHLAFGGVERAIINMANLFAERYDVEIISVYNMPDSPAYPIDKRVKVRYLLDDIPNRVEWRAAAKGLPGELYKGKCAQCAYTCGEAARGTPRDRRYIERHSHHDAA